MPKELSSNHSIGVEDQSLTNKVAEKFMRDALPKIIENEEWRKRSNPWEFYEHPAILPQDVILRLGE